MIKKYDWIEKQRKDAEKIFKPKMLYDEENDILNIFWFPKADYDFSLETESNIVFDIAISGQIKGIEIHGFQQKLKKDEQKLKDKKVNFMIHMLKELQAGNDCQKVIKSSKDTGIVLGLVHEEVEKIW